MATPRAKLQLTKPRLEPEPATAGPAERETLPQASGARPDREGKRLIAGHFPRATWAQLRALGTELDKNNQELLAEALDDLFAKHRKH